MTCSSGVLTKIKAWSSNKIGIFKCKVINVDNVNEGDNTVDSEILKGGTIEDPPDGGLRAWLIVASCSVINVLIGILEPTLGLALLSSKDDTGIDENILTEMYNIYISLGGIYAPVASVSMATLGYKWTVHIGAWCLSTACLILSFVKDLHAIKFILFVIAGVGSSLVHLGTLVPILEYFTSKRIRALMISKISRYCGQLITVVVVLSGAKLTWQSLYRICMGLSIPIAFIGLTIPSLQSNQGITSTTFVNRALVYLRVFKNVFLWIVCTLFFFYHIGSVPPLEVFKDGHMLDRLGVKSGADKIVYSLSTGIGLITGAFLGWLFKFSADRKLFRCLKQKPTTKEMLRIFLMLMGGIPVVMAILCFVAPESPNFHYFCIFIVLFSAQLVFIEELREDILPDVFGQANMKMVEGLLQMFIGIGGVIASESAAELNWKNSFRMGGGLLFVTSAVSISILLLRPYITVTEIKVKPEIKDNTENLSEETGPSSSISQLEASADNITESTIGATEVEQIHSSDMLQEFSLKYKSKTSYGPSNMKFVIPRQNRMYGSHETSSTSSDDSATIDNKSLQNKNTRAAGQTIYTDLHSSRSPDSYGIAHSDGHWQNNVHIDGNKSNPSQHNTNIIYSYNITHNIESDINDIDLL